MAKIYLLLKMRKLFLSSGHSNIRGKDMGAIGNGYIEGVLTVEFRDLLNTELQKLGVCPILDQNSNILSETIKYFKNIITGNSDLLLDIHWNSSSNPSATGCETLVPNNPTQYELKVAKEISKKISEILGIKDRGVKTESQSARGSLGWMRLSGENIIIEICFISNPDDMKKYQKNKLILAKELAKLIKESI